MYQYTKVQLVKRKDYQEVIIYYSKKGTKFRPSTGVKVLHKNVTKGGSISTTHPNFEEDAKRIKAMQDRVENLVASYKERYGEKPPVSWLEVEFEKPVVDAKKNLQDALCYWGDFIAEKEKVLRNEKTVNRYNNLAYAIENFKQKKNLDISFELLDQEFFNGFLYYLINEHEHVRSVQQLEYTKPEVGLTNDTAIKRLKDFTEYLKYCTIEHDIQINLEKIKRYISNARHRLEVRPLSKTQKWELTLTTDEIAFVVNLDHYEPDFWESLSDNQRRYIDILIFMCLQGTAPIDTKGIKKTDIRNGKIIKERSKSGNEFKVDLDPIAEDILERNNYDLDFTDQVLNGELKRIFVTVFELYRKHYESKHNEPYQIICIQKTKKGNQEVLKIQHKGLFVELMTGRRSFLTNLGEKAGEFGIKEMMSKAGHTQISTTLGYIHERQQAEKRNGGLFHIQRLK